MSGAARAVGADVGEAYVRVTQVRSGIGTKPKHRATLRALGLRGVGRARVLPDRPEIRGMIARVSHLVELSSAEQVEADQQRAVQLAQRAARSAAARREQA